MLRAVAAAKKVAPLIASKKVGAVFHRSTEAHRCLTQVVNNITKWTQIQEELSSDIPSTPDVIPAPVTPPTPSA